MLSLTVRQQWIFEGIALEDTESVELMAKYLYAFDYSDASSPRGGPLAINTKMYLLANEYKMPDLASLALQKFKRVAQFLHSGEGFVAALKAIYDKRAITASDDQIRSLVVDLWLHNGPHLIAGPDRALLSRMVTTTPLFLMDLTMKCAKALDASTDGHTTAEHESYPRRNRDPVSF